MNLDAALNNPGQILNEEEDWEKGHQETIRLLESFDKDTPYLVVCLDPNGAWVQGNGTDSMGLFAAIGMICEILYRGGALPAPTYRYRNIMDDLFGKEKSTCQK